MLAFALAAALTLAGYQANQACADGTMPAFSGDTIALACKNKKAPAPVTPATPLKWRMHGQLAHSNDPSSPYSQATNAIEGAGVFYDITDTRDAWGCAGWRMVAAPACVDGSQNIVWAGPQLPDLTAKYGAAAFAYATFWPTPLSVFNGINCPARPAGSGVRYPVYAPSIPDGQWTAMPIWWPNGLATPSCAPDSNGRSATAEVWRGTVSRSFTINGVTQTVSLPMTCGQTFWFPTPTPYEMEELCFYGPPVGGLAFYGLWCDSNLGPKNCAAASPPVPALTSAGADPRLPALPTGSPGAWLLQIWEDYADIEAESGPGGTGMPAGWTASQFMSSAFPGPAP